MGRITQATKPDEQMLGPGVSDMVYRQRCQQDQDEDTMQALQGAHPHIRDSQAIFLTKAIGMANLRAIARIPLTDSQKGGIMMEGIETKVSFGETRNQSVLQAQLLDPSPAAGHEGA